MFFSLIVIFFTIYDGIVPTVAGSGAIQILIVAVADTGIYANVVAEDDKDCGLVAADSAAFLHIRSHKG